MIRITFIAAGVRGAPVEHDTDDTQEALSAEVAKWYATSGTEHPAETSLFAVLVERDDHSLNRAECAEKLREIASFEDSRAHTHGEQLSKQEG